MLIRFKKWGVARSRCRSRFCSTTSSFRTWPARGKPSAAAALSSAQEIGHAVAIVGYLQAALGQKDAGKINGSLRRFYVMLREKPMEAQVRSFAANPE
jgi:hypothetical protein